MFDEKFVRLDTRRLCELTSAADALDMKPLVDLTSRALARLIEGKTPEQVRALTAERLWHHFAPACQSCAVLGEGIETM